MRYPTWRPTWRHHWQLRLGIVVALLLLAGGVGLRTVPKAHAYIPCSSTYEVLEADSGAVWSYGFGMRARIYEERDAVTDGPCSTTVEGLWDTTNSTACHYVPVAINIAHRLRDGSWYQDERTGVNDAGGCNHWGYGWTYFFSYGSGTAVDGCTWWPTISGPPKACTTWVVS